MSDDKHQIDCLSLSLLLEPLTPQWVACIRQPGRAGPANARQCLCSFAVCSTLTSLGVPMLADASETHGLVPQSAQPGVVASLPSAALCTAGNVSTPLLTCVGLYNVNTSAATHSDKRRKSVCGALWDMAPLEKKSDSAARTEKKWIAILCCVFVAILYFIGTLILYFSMKHK